MLKTVMTWETKMKSCARERGHTSQCRWNRNATGFVDMGLGSGTRFNIWSWERPFFCVSDFWGSLVCYKSQRKVECMGPNHVELPNPGWRLVIEPRENRVWERKGEKGLGRIIPIASTLQRSNFLKELLSVIWRSVVISGDLQALLENWQAYNRCLSKV